MGLIITFCWIMTFACASPLPMEEAIWRESSRLQDFQQQKSSSYQGQSYSSHKIFPTKDFLTPQAPVKEQGLIASYPTCSFVGAHNFSSVQNSSFKTKKSHLDGKIFRTHVMAPKNDLYAKHEEYECFTKKCSVETRRYTSPSKKGLKDHQVPPQALQKTWSADTVRTLLNKGI